MVATNMFAVVIAANILGHCGAYHRTRSRLPVVGHAAPRNQSTNLLLHRASDVQAPPLSTASAKLFTRPIDERWLCFITTAMLFDVIAWTTSCILIYKHYLAGTAVTGTYAPSSRAKQYINLVKGVPVFSLTSLLGILLPEMGPVWQFLETLVMAQTFWLMPDLFYSVAGGPVELQLKIKETKADHWKNKEGELPTLYGNPPCCCMRRCYEVRPPRQTDVLRLRWGVYQICFVLPTIALLEMIWDLEIVMGSQFFAEALSGIFWEILSKVIMITSIFICMSSLTGIDVLVGRLNPKARDDLSLERKQLFCRSFLIGLNLIPMVASLLPVNSDELRNGQSLSAWDKGQTVRALAICVSALFCSFVASIAFPPDEKHYPELHGGHLDMTKSKLECVQVCPFCGSESLHVESYSLETETVTCLSCNTTGIPAQLHVRREIGVTPAFGEH